MLEPAAGGNFLVLRFVNTIFPLFFMTRQVFFMIIKKNQNLRFCFHKKIIKKNKSLRDLEKPLKKSEES